MSLSPRVSQREACAKFRGLCAPAKSPYSAEKATMDAAFREGSHKPNMRTVHSPDAGMKILSLSRIATPQPQEQIGGK